MIQEEIVRHDLFYHSAHGLCRVDELIKENRSGKKVLSYSLVPKSTTRMKVRFVIAESDMEISGFHPLISVKEANKIVAYLKAGDAKQEEPAEEGALKQVASRFDRENHPWKLARGLLAYCRPWLEIKDQRKRQMLERSAKGLVEELALVFKITLEETALKIQKNLGKISPINPLVLDALKKAARG